MKLLIFAAMACCAHGQTCAYNTGKFPVGQVLVYRNGGILRQGQDFSFKITAGVPTITPITWAPADKFSTVFSITIPLTANGAAYTSYRIWQENWTCPGSAVAPDQPIHCESGTIAASSFVGILPVPSNVETTIMQLPANWRFEQITLCETERFLGQTSITASMGRPGSSNYELSGTLVPLGVSANNSACWTARPTPPQFVGPYPIVVNIAATTVDPVSGATLPGDLTQLSAGVLTWEVCGYKALIGDPSVIGVPKVGALKVCSGSGVNADGTQWDCGGLYQVQIRRADGSLLPIMGASMSPGAPVSGVIWTDIK